MVTATYALKITLVDKSGVPIIRCWGPSFDVVDGVPSSPGWHHFIVSFDSSIPRVQMAMDRNGGPVLGGGVLDTKLGTGEIDASGGFPSTPPAPVGGTAPQQMFATLKSSSLNGFAPTPGTLSEQKDWELDADLSTPTDFAYCYYGVPSTFFDLTVSGNLNYFISNSNTAVNLGPAGNKVPMTCLFMHTGNATSDVFFGSPEINEWQGYINYPFTALVSFEGKNYFSIFIGDNINNRPDISPDFWDIFVGKPEFQFPYNAATGRLWGGTVLDALTQPPLGA